MEKINGVNIYESEKAYDVLKLIENNPTRYIMSATISSLQDFLNGYLTGNPYPKDSPPFWDFENYLISQTKFNEKHGFANRIARILLSECNGNEQKAFKRFFEYVEKYKSSY